ncbi:phosphatidate cytidylyltransferase [hydrocarbon metagenome]|uniref:Phosphatidate cytidylyltransferase n=1 Tax=hydrocarbon metagenome TaxID=938273 RepID=A0A0W8FHM2_9ZZZZ
MAIGSNDIAYCIVSLVSALWMMIPAYIPNPVAVVFGGGTPIDRGMRFLDGKRLLGDGKTYRGFIAGVLAGILAGAILIRLRTSFGLDVLPAHTLLSVILLAAGALLGDMAKSFLKRRAGKERGEKWPIADQYDLVAGSLLLVLIAMPGWLLENLTLPMLVWIIIVTPILHRATNIIGYLAGVKDVPW